VRTARHFPLHGWLGLLLVLCGETLIVAQARPLSDFYFPLVWAGYVLVLDAGLLLHERWSPLTRSTRLAAALFPLSALFWWIFELFNRAVHNWVYVGAQAYTGVKYVAVASLDFSFVLPGVWMSALVIARLVSAAREDRRAIVPRAVLIASVGAGILCIALPVLFPRYFFGLIWVSLFFVIDPLNYRAGRPSLIELVFRGDWRTPLCLALAALTCGFFWESWNYWAMPKWIYRIPYVNHWHVFEMPLLGWTGYLPFGLELFAMANFVLPRLGLGTLDIVPVSRPEPGDTTLAAS
jgi:hypothetical protein